MSKISELRWQAAQEGRIKFSTGQPCFRGHVSERYVSTGACIACVRPPKAPRQVTLTSMQLPVRFVALCAVDMTGAQQIALTNYLHRCVIAFHEQQGLHPPIHVDSLRFAESQGVRYEDVRRRRRNRKAERVES